MNIFIDAEFIDNGKTVRPLSIGLVNEIGGTLYRIVRDLKAMRDAYRNQWLRDNVIKYMPVKLDRTHILQWDKDHPDYKYVQGKKEIAKDMREFVGVHAQPKIWGYYASYDFLVYAQFYGRMLDVPPSMPMWIHELKQLLEDFPLAQWPEQAEGLHNALSDAQWNKKLWEYAMFLKRARSGLQGLTGGNGE